MLPQSFQKSNCRSCFYNHNYCSTHLIFSLQYILFFVCFFIASRSTTSMPLITEENVFNTSSFKRNNESCVGFHLFYLHSKIQMLCTYCKNGITWVPNHNSPLTLVSSPRYWKEFSSSGLNHQQWYCWWGCGSVWQRIRWSPWWQTRSPWPWQFFGILSYLVWCIFWRA